MNTKTRERRIRYCHSLMRLNARYKVKRFYERNGRIVFVRVVCKKGWR